MRPTRYKREYAVPQSVADLLRKFDYPDLDTRPGPPFIAGGGGTPTIVIAASDASDISKGKADFVCTGVNDQETIQAAIDPFIPSSPFQGLRVLLTEGTFNIDMAGQPYEGIRLDYGTIQGMGSEATIINATSDPSVANNPVIYCPFTHCTVRDLSVQGGNATAVTGVEFAGEQSVIENCYLSTNGRGVQITGSGGFCTVRGNWMDCDVGVFVNAANHFIINNYIFYTSTGIEGTGVHNTIAGNLFEGDGFAVDNTGDQDWLIEGNQFISTQGCRFGTAADNCAVIDNRFDTGGQVLFTATVNGCKVSGNIWDVNGAIVFAAGATNCQITDNQLQDSGTLDAIRVESGLDVMISGNQISEGAINGIVVNSSDRVTVAENMVKWSAEHGIVLAGDNCTIRDNTVFGSSQDTTNTFDNINVNGDANLVMGNHSIPATIAPLTRNGINIVGGNGNAVYANALGLSSGYGTNDFIDGGVGTQTAPGANGQFAF